MRAGGRAFYRRAELLRLRGEFALAEAAYREAGRRGTEPQPGLSLLRLAQGDVEAASASIRRVASEAVRRQGQGSGPVRLEVLRACVEIMIAADDVDAAEAAAVELEALAAGIDALYVRASALQTAGAVRLARGGDAEAALAVLRDAWTAWQQLEAPYESAEARVLIGRACHGLGDVDTARIHYDAAAHTFERLGAAPALAGLGTSSTPPGAAESRLTGRELEVVRLVATGRTNRQIAAVLSISEHTVARHLSNVFDKLGVASRTAAATFAIERGLL